MKQPFVDLSCNSYEIFESTLENFMLCLLILLALFHKIYGIFFLEKNCKFLWQKLCNFYRIISVKCPILVPLFIKIDCEKMTAFL